MENKESPELKIIPKSSILTNLWFWWVLLTVVYVVLVLAGGTGTKATSLIGLFVPIGPLSLFGNILTGGITLSLGLGVMLAALYFGNKLINKIQRNKIIKIFIILIYLFVLTLIVDYIIWGGWNSMVIFIGKGETSKWWFQFPGGL